MHDGLGNILQNVSLSLRLIGFLLDFHYRQINAKTDITRGKHAAQKMLTFNVRMIEQKCQSYPEEVRYYQTFFFIIYCVYFKFQF